MSLYSNSESLIFYIGGKVFRYIALSYAAFLIWFMIVFLKKLVFRICWYGDGVDRFYGAVSVCHLSF